jgi:hypothetical protein
LLPTLEPVEIGKVIYPPILSLGSDPVTYRTGSWNALLPALSSAMDSLFHGKTSGGKIDWIADQMRIGSPDAMLAHLKSLDGGGPFKKKVASIRSSDSDLFQGIIDYTFAYLSPYILEAVDRQVAEFMAGVTYLGPLRSSAERIYRLQELSVDEVDPDGKNLAMFLRSLSPSESASFTAFTRTYLGFESTIRTEGLQAEILVKEPGADRLLNLVDVGFGYTEVLPITATLWSTCVRAPNARRRRTSLLAIEQPELHLHPAYQAKLARMIVGAHLESRKAQREVRIMVETHSEGLVNGLGELVYEKLINPSDVQIVLFDQNESTRQTSVRFAGYDDEGALRDWPFGFFAPVADA